MKLKGILTLLLALTSAGVFAQTHIEGEEYYKAGQLLNAEDILLRSLNNPTTDKSVSDYYLGMIAYEKGDLTKASDYFSQGIAANPDYAFNYVGQGLLKLKANDPKTAQTFFKEAQKRDKKNASLEVAIANAYYMVNPIQYEKEINKQIEKAEKINALNPDLSMFLGDRIKDTLSGADQLTANKIAGDAANKYESAFSYDQNATAAYVKYADLFTNIKPQYAIEKLKLLLQVNPNSALGQRELARAYENAKDYANAAIQYGKYVQNPSHFKRDESQYAFLLFLGKDYKKGYDYATELLSKDPSDFTAQRFQFMNAAQLPEMADALLPMAEALYNSHKRNPEKNKMAIVDFNLIADEFQKAKRPEDAQAVIEEGITAFPENAGFHSTLAFIYVDEAQYTKAADAYQAYLNMLEQPTYNDLVQQALLSYYGGSSNLQTDLDLANKYLNMAADYANKAAAMDAKQYKPIKILGDIDIAKAANDDARKSAAFDDYMKAINLLENSADPSKYTSDAKTIYSYLGNYYIDKKDNENAKIYFNKYLELAPDDNAVRDFVNKLK